MSYAALDHPYAPAAPSWFRYYKQFNLVLQASKTATANGSTVTTNVEKAECAATLNALNTAGTTPTLDVVIQESADGSTWTQIAAFTQVTTGGAYQRITFSKTQKKVRAVYTIGGTSSPAYTISVNLEE